MAVRCDWGTAGRVDFHELAGSLANVAGATFDLNGNSTTLKSLSGGGSTGGTVAMGSGNLTFSGGANATFAGALTGTGNVTVGGGSSQASQERRAIRAPLRLTLAR